MHHFILSQLSHSTIFAELDTGRNVLKCPTFGIVDTWNQDIGIDYLKCASGTCDIRLNQSMAFGKHFNIIAEINASLQSPYTAP